MGLTIGNVLRRSFNQNKLPQFRWDAVVVAVKQQVEAFHRGG